MKVKLIGITLPPGWVLLSTALILLMSVTAFATTESKIISNMPQTMDMFGFSVNIDEDYAIVGSGLFNPGDGRAHIFHKVENIWERDTVLTVEGIPAPALLGTSVNLDGRRAICGAPVTMWDTPKRDRSADAAFVFYRGDDGWIMEGELFSEDSEDGDDFGGQVAICGDYAVVAARYDDVAAINDGSVYVFCNFGEEWVETQHLTAFDADSADCFGASIAISDEWLVIGSPNDRDQAGYPAGSVYFYHLEQDEWVFHSKVNARDDAGPIWFGMSVSISGEYVAVTKWSDSEAVPGTSAYIYRLVGDSWELQQRVTGEDADRNEWIAMADISGDYLVLGNCCDNDTTRFTGCAYLFKKEGDNWQQIEKLQASDRCEGAHFGNAVSIDQGNVLIGAWGDRVENREQSGSAYIYTGFIPNEVAGDDPVPTNPVLLRTYPNPFNSMVTIQFTRPINREATRLADYGQDGKLVADLADIYPPFNSPPASKGVKGTFVWNASGVPAGSYLVRLDAGGVVQTERIILVK